MPRAAPDRWRQYSLNGLLALDRVRTVQKQARFLVELEGAQVDIAGAEDTKLAVDACVLSTGRVLPGKEPQIGRKLPTRREVGRLADAGRQHHSDQRTDAGTSASFRLVSSVRCA